MGKNPAWRREKGTTESLGASPSRDPCVRRDAATRQEWHDGGMPPLALKATYDSGLMTHKEGSSLRSLSFTLGWTPAP